MQLATALYIVGNQVVRFPRKQVERVFDSYLGEYSACAWLTRRRARVSPPVHPARILSPLRGYSGRADAAGPRWCHPCAVLRQMWQVDWLARGHGGYQDVLVVYKVSPSS